MTPTTRRRPRNPSPSTRTGPQRLRWRLPVVLAVLLIAGLGFGGCSAGGGEGGGAASGARAEPQHGQAEAASSGKQDGGGQQDLSGRKVIRTGSLTLVSDDLAASRDKVDALLSRVGGHVAQARTHSNDKGMPVRSTLKLRVPTDKFDQVMTTLASIGRLEEAHRDSEDVTQEVVDVNSRVATQRASLKRLRGFLDRAKDIDAVLRVEKQITKRRADLESLLARQKQLRQQTSMATVTVHMRAPEDVVAEPGTFDQAGFLSGLRGGWQALQVFVVGAATVVGAVLPFVLAFAVVGVPLLIWLRRVLRRRAGGTPSSTAAE